MQHALTVVEKQRAERVPEELVDSYNDGAAANWDKFYSWHENSFFKDRHWLRKEFPELFSSTDLTTTKHIFEIGCGAEEDANNHFFVYAADFSKKAVEVVKSNAAYDPTRCNAFVYDITNPKPPTEIPPGSLDICICIFVLSAIHKKSWETAANNIFNLLKPGGIVLFRDYGRYDLTQLRFKKGRLLDDNFYIRGDGTQVYFFDQV
ncbi:hypothetical protein HK101_009410 [Irineochytrium annulatum]|nr:hypothetical protein HK101_009410 [Irineochytrium annulatum]